MTGRPPKSTALHKAQGTFQPCRHGDRVDEILAVGEPTKPNDLDDDATWLWDLVCGSLPETARSILDTPLLLAMCEWWSLYRRYARRAQKGEGNEYNTLLMTVNAFKQFDGCASRFGLTPADRVRLKIQAPPLVPDDPLAQMMKRRAGLG